MAASGVRPRCALLLVLLCWTPPCQGAPAEPAARTPQLTAYLDRSNYTREQHARLIVTVHTDPAALTRLALKATLSKDGEVVFEKWVPRLTGRHGVVDFGVLRLPAGTYQVAATLLHAGASLAHVELALTKLLRQRTEAKTDHEYTRLLVNGEPFFAIGAYGVPAQAFPEVAEAGFNTVVTEPSTHYLQAAESLGLKAFIDLPLALPPARSDAFLARLEAELKAMPSRIRTVHDCAALIGYYMVGEPDRTLAPHSPDGTGEAICSRLYEAAKQSDPHRMIWATFGRRLTFAGGYDIGAVHSYWCPSRGETPEAVVGPVRAAVAYAAKRRRPAWFVAQASTWSGGDVALSPRRQRCQVYLALINGVKGVVWWGYSYRPPDEAAWREISRLAGELSQLGPILLSDGRAEHLSTGPKPIAAGAATADLQPEPLHVLLKEHGARQYLIVANPTETHRTMLCTQPLPWGAHAVKVLFEDRSIVVSDGSFRDTFTGYATHVYEIPGPIGTDPLRISSGEATAPPAEAPATDKLADLTGSLLRNGAFEPDAERGLPEWDRNVWPTWSPGGWQLVRDVPGAHGACLRIATDVPAYSPGQTYGWTEPDAAVRGGTMHTPDPVLTDFCESEAYKQAFRVDVPNGTYDVRLVTKGAEAVDVRVGGRAVSTKQPEDLSSRELEHVSSRATAHDGHLLIEFLRSRARWFLHALEITSVDGEHERMFDFGTPSSPVGNGWIRVACPPHGRVWTKQRVRVQPDQPLIFSVRLRGDRDGLPVRLAVYPYHWFPWSADREMRLTTEWQEYALMTTVPKGLQPEGLVFVSFETTGAPGTAWADDACLRPAGPSHER